MSEPTTPSAGSPFVSLLRWIDNERFNLQQQIPQDYKVDWLRCIPFFFMHFACLLVFLVGWSWTAIAVCVFLYFFRMFAITGFYHRYFSHRTFKTTRAFQFVMAVWGALSVQRGALWWAAHHRLHHRHSDHEEDVHSPHQHGFWWSHMFWITSKANFPTHLKEVKDLTKFQELRLLDRFDIVVPISFAFFLLFLGMGLNYFLPQLGTSGPQILVWGFFVSTVLLFHGTCTINSLSHVFGNRRYETTDQSRNNFLLALVTMGEGWHNNHHHYPASARQGFFWWEIDVTFYLLKTLSVFGIIWDLKPVPDHVRDGTSRPAAVA